MKLTIDLDEVWANEEWGTTVGEIVKEEIRFEVKRIIKAAVKNDPQLKLAVKRLTDLAAKSILENL